MSEQISHSQSIPEIHNRPMGPLEEGDQAIIDAIESLPERKVQSPIKEGWLSGERSYGNSYTTLSNEVDGGVRFVSTYQKNPKGKRLSRKHPVEIAQVKVNRGLITAEIRDLADSRSGDASYSEATRNNMVESGRLNNNGVIREPVQTNRVEHQAIKKEAARRIEATRRHLGKVGVDLSAR